VSLNEKNEKCDILEPNELKNAYNEIDHSPCYRLTLLHSVVLCTISAF